MLFGDLAAGDLTLPANLAGMTISGLSSDSRAVKPGFLFAALPGSLVDGAGYAADAVSRGAVAILADIDAAIDVPADIAVVRTDDPRRALARFAARFYPKQPENLVAVTGTSGKTSVVEFARQIFQAAGHKAASVGTLGVVGEAGTRKGSLTTPETVSLHDEIDRLARDGTTHLAIEASSHGLDQRRLDGLRIKAAAFTNLGRDHLDYHHDEADYFAAKLRLFSDLLPANGSAVIDVDSPHGEQVREIAARRGQTVTSVGRAAEHIILRDVTADGFGQAVHISIQQKDYRLIIPLAGAFQVSNALVAAGLALAVGIDGDTVAAALEQLKGAPGRLEFVGRRANGAMIFVDYAHKPDALIHMLAALRPMTRGRLVVLFGAGGDRDHGKRQLMGQAATANADVVIVTDDNPRSEDPAAIRSQVRAGCPDGCEIGDRADAIATALDMLRAGDALLVAGKGHETGQEIAGVLHPFSDHDVIAAHLGSESQ